MPTEKLHCRAGHDFTREATKGRKPHWCPEHRPVVAKPAQRRTAAPEAPQEEEQKLTAVLSKALLNQIVAETTEVLIMLPDGDETKRKLQYIIRQLKSGKRDGNDTKLLRETRDRLLSDVRRRYSVTQ